MSDIREELEKPKFLFTGFTCTWCGRIQKVKPKIVGIGYLAECEFCNKISTIFVEDGICHFRRKLDEMKTPAASIKELTQMPRKIQNEPIARLDLIDPDVLLRVGGVLQVGEKKYGRDNWRRITKEDHVNHALCHLIQFLRNDQSEDHLINAICRCMFAASKHTIDDRETKWIKENNT